MERTSKLERTLFKAVRILMLVAALLALLFAIIQGATGLIKSNASADERIQPPTLSFEAYVDQLAKEKAAKDTADQGKAAQEGDDPSKKPVPQTERNPIPSEFRDVLNEIEKSVANYAEKTAQPAPTNALRVRLYDQAASRFNTFGLVQDFLGKLAAVSKTLESKGEELGKLDDGDPRKVFWGKFLDFAYDAYETNLNSQARAINDAKREAAMTRLEASGLYLRAGIAAGAFLGLTLLLVLLSIEKNTYVSSHALRSAYPGASEGPAALYSKRRPSQSQPENVGETAS